MGEVTELIGQAQAGDRAASDRLFSVLYDELKRLARAQLVGANSPLHATSLVHEAYCKLSRGAVFAVNDRQHFYALAARAMRQIVINAVRARDAQRRGGDVHIDALDTQALRAVAAEGLGEDVLALDEALGQLAQLSPQLEQLVELRFFAGLELTDIAPLLDRSERSLKRDWRRARAFLYARLGDGGEDTSPLPPPAA